jgi:biopolymer transport protein ExbB
MLGDGLKFLLHGGPMMWPLFLCAIVSVAVMIERAVMLRQVSGNAEWLTQHLTHLLEKGQDADLLRAAASHPGPISMMFTEAVKNRDLKADLLELKLEKIALTEAPKLTKRLNILDTIITISPLLGLLGTVTGMIGAFHVVGDPSSLNGPGAITGGVAEALIATATGLAIAIVTLVGYNTLGERVKNVVSSMELAGTDIVNAARERERNAETLRVNDGATSPSAVAYASS